MLAVSRTSPSGTALEVLPRDRGGGLAAAGSGSEDLFAVAVGLAAGFLLAAAGAGVLGLAVADLSGPVGGDGGWTAGLGSGAARGAGVSGSPSNKVICGTSFGRAVFLLFFIR